MTDGGRPRVKVCGHTRPADVRASVAAGVDAVGVITEVSIQTPREVAVERAARLLDLVPPFVTGVLVTMPDDVDHAVDLLARVRADAIQLHGHLSIEQLERLVDVIRVPVVVAVDATERSRIDRLDGLVDAILVDSTDEHGAGGTGRVHDWERTRQLVETIETPVVLAGGLTPGNVAEAVAAVGPFGVDVASGVERRGGVKDHDAVRRFVSAAVGDAGVTAPWE